MKLKKQYRFSVVRLPTVFPRFLASTVALVVTIGVLHFAFPASSAPVTSTATSKLTVYQGVVTVAPGAAGDSILELGNAGRDIAGSGDIYVRPGSLSGATTNFARFYASGSKAYLSVPYLTLTAQDAVNEGGEFTLQKSSAAYHDWMVDLFQDRLRIFSNGVEKFTVDSAGTGYITKLCFGGYGSVNCASTWAAAGVSTLDAVLAAGNTGNNKVIVLNNQAVNSQSFGTTSGASVGVGSFAFLSPSLNNGSYSDVTRASDSGLFFAQSTGLTVSGWNTSGTIKGLHVGGGTAATAALSVNNGLAGTGSSGDTIAAYANSANSAIFGQQNNPSGYAAYFTNGSSGSTTKPTLYAENLFNQGFGDGVEANAGLFVGDVEIHPWTSTALVNWPIGSVLKVASDQFNTSDGATLDVRNLGPSLAGNFEGPVRISNNRSLYPGLTINTTTSSTALQVTSARSELAGFFNGNVQILGYMDTGCCNSAYPYVIGASAGLFVSASAQGGAHTIGIRSQPTPGSQGSSAFYTNVPVGTTYGYGFFGETSSNNQNLWAFMAHGKIGKKGSASSCNALAEPFKTNCINSFGIEVPAVGASTGVAGSGFQDCTDTCRSNGLQCVMSWTGGTGATAPSFGACDTDGVRQCLCGNTI